MREFSEEEWKRSKNTKRLKVGDSASTATANSNAPSLDTETNSTPNDYDKYRWMIDQKKKKLDSKPKLVFDGSLYSLKHERHEPDWKIAREYSEMMADLANNSTESNYSLGLRPYTFRIISRDPDGREISKSIEISVTQSMAMAYDFALTLPDNNGEPWITGRGIKISGSSLFASLKSVLDTAILLSSPIELKELHKKSNI